uniref:Galectin n=1 Tax=Meloidogyne hapla TaxID=6305 RepID=A0A1I8BAA8_MELHA
MFSDQLITNETKNEMIKGGKLKNKECLKSETCLLLYSCFSNDKEEDCENSIKEYINPIGRVKFTIRIYLNEKEYQIQINNGKDLINFENNIPSWAIDHVMVKGDVTDIKYGKEATTCNQPKDVHLPPNILYIDQDNRPLDGEVIIIKGTVEKEIEENDITVSFLYEALNWHEKFGKTIFRANFSKDGNTSFGSYPAPKSKRNDKNKIELKWIEFEKKENKETWRKKCEKQSKILNETDKFSLVIILLKEQYKVYYNDMDCDFKAYYPHWAIQYIVVSFFNIVFPLKKFPI